MKITVIGGGNVGTLMAAEMAAKGHEVTMYTRDPKRWSHDLTVLDEGDNVLLEASLSCVTDSIEQAVNGAELIWVVTPATTFRNIAAMLEPHVKANQLIGVVPGSGGAEFAFFALIQKGCRLFGLQRVHSIARLKEYGRSVHMLGRKSGLQIGMIPATECKDVCKMAESLFDLPTEALTNYLNVTLTPSNPILHTTRLYQMFRDYKAGVIYPRNFHFYDEWDDPSSQRLLACDDELQELCRAIPLDLNAVVPLRTYYESADAQAMTKKIRSIKAFHGLTSPMKREGEGWVPDFSSRYFTSDFSFGLKVLIDLADEFGVPVPNMKVVWEWYQDFRIDDSCFSLKISKDDILKMYSR